MPADTTRQANRDRLAARRAAEAAARARAERRRRTILGGVVAAVAVLVALVVVIAVQMQRTSPSAGAAVPANVDGTVISVGAADAPVTVDLYEDFQCPNCKAFEDATGSTLAQLVADGTVQARYHGMAFLDTSANDQYSTRALDAAAVVVVAGGSEAFQTFHDLLYANQPDEGRLRPDRRPAHRLRSAGRCLGQHGGAGHPGPDLRGLGGDIHRPGESGGRDGHPDGPRRRPGPDRTVAGRTDRRGHRRPGRLTPRGDSETCRPRP